jgi:hypothetical protein
MSDYGEIASLVARLAWKVDHQEYDDYMEHWVEGGRLRYTDVDGQTNEWTGEEILGLIKVAYDPPNRLCLHVVTTPIIDIDGDRARVRYYTLHLLPGPDAQPCGVGEYDTVVQRGADGRWRMAEMSEVQLLAYDRVPAA